MKRQGRVGCQPEPAGGFVAATPWINLRPAGFIWRLASGGAAIGIGIGLAGCVAGPDYKRPVPEMPAAWKLEAPFREGRPSDGADKGRWWQRFGDPRLDALEDQALANSPNLSAAAARLAQARASLGASGAARYPQVTLGSRDSRLKISADRPLTNYAAPNFTTVQSDFNLSLNVSYEADLAGRIQRTIEGAVATAEQTAADLENVRLMLTSDLASNYFSLRSLDIELDVVQRSILLQRRALDFIVTRHDLGAASGLEVAQQQSLLDSTLTQVEVLLRQRGPYEHAIATLTGTPAPLFTLASDVRDILPPEIPIGLPSDVLERRPDIAAAERAMAVANAQIGVAQASFYPSVTLAPSGGVEARRVSLLFDAPSLLWSLGVSATQVLFDGGRLRANLAVAEGGYQITTANYRRVVLTAMQEVEDGITGLAALARARDQSQVAAQSARRVFDMATARYEGGASTYLDVITAQQSLLGTERQSAQLRGQQLLASVFLVKALGGDWQPNRRVAGG